MATAFNQNQEQEAAQPGQSWKKIDPTLGWEKVVKTMTEYDEKRVEGWKDELSNLLIFVRHLFVSFHAIYPTDGIGWEE